MFGQLFTPQKVATKAPKLSQKEMNALIDEIHESFYTEVDKLLAHAKVKLSTDTTKQALIDKCNRLEALGFTQTKEVVEARKEIQRLNTLEIENEKRSKLTEAINYFSNKYPQYKFITEESVKKICEKYNLVYGSIANYRGTVPDENLRQMENFSIKEQDKIYLQGYRGTFSGQTKYEAIDLKTYKDRSQSDIWARHGNFSYKEAFLEIAAPAKDFDMTGMELNGTKIVAKPIEIPDPVVLQPVIYDGVKHYLIVTAWGQEASDELVVNERNN